MNYIVKLKLEIAAKDAQIASLEKSMNSFRVFLNTPKFTGTETDGGRKDWIATGDVIAWLCETSTAAIMARESVSEPIKPITAAQHNAFPAGRWS